MTATYETFSAGKTAPATDTIREMLNAFNAAGASLSGAYSPDQIRGMERAAKVLLELVLGPVTDQEWYSDHALGFRAMTDRILAHRRALIEQPEAQTLQDRVFAIMDKHGKGGDGAWECAQAIAKEVENA
jgi:hypothetical protein